MGVRSKPLTETVQRLFAEEVQSRTRRGEPDFPSIGELARHYNVSYQTMRTVVRQSAQSGRVQLRQGCRPTLSGSVREPRKSSSAGRICGEIREKIMDGTYRVGAFLPKFKHFQLSFSVSSQTVLDALTLLNAEKLVHKHGKRWVVGPPPRQSVEPKYNPRISGKPVVLVIANRFGTWHFLRYRNIHLPRFLLEFEHELRKNEVDIMPVFAEKPSGERLVIGGREGIEALVERLGPGYLGTLFVGSPDWYSPPLPYWITLAGRLGRPIVWFDTECKGEGIDRRSFTGCKEFYRCYWNDRGATALVLETLSGLGHNVIGMPSFPGYDGDWQARRVELVRTAARSCRPPIAVVSPQLSEDFWIGGGDWWEAPSFLGRIRRDASLAASEGFAMPTGRRLFAATPTMRLLLRQKRTTALVAVNDDIAREYVSWLCEAGVPVPGEVSVVSFDNQEISQVFDIASVDFGLVTLGYQAAHLLLGDIPVKTDDRWGNLGSKPALIARGSLGRARPGGRDGG